MIDGFEHLKRPAYYVMLIVYVGAVAIVGTKLVFVVSMGSRVVATAILVVIMVSAGWCAEQLVLKMTTWWDYTRENWRI